MSFHEKKFGKFTVTVEYNEDELFGDVTNSIHVSAGAFDAEISELTRQGEGDVFLGGDCHRILKLPAAQWKQIYNWLETEDHL